MNALCRNSESRYITFSGRQGIEACAEHLDVRGRSDRRGHRGGPIRRLVGLVALLAAGGRRLSLGRGSHERGGLGQGEDGGILEEKHRM